MATSTISKPTLPTIQSPLQRFWQRITRPHPSLNDTESQGNARLLAALLLIMLTVGGSIMLYIFVTNIATAMQDPGMWLTAAGWFVLLIGYGFNRTGHTRTAAALLIGTMFAIFTFVPFLENTRDTLAYFGIIPILLTAIFFPLRYVYGLAIITGICFVAMGRLTPDYATRDIEHLLQFYIFATAVLLVFIYHVKSVERLRREALLEAQALRELDDLKSQFLASMSHELRTPLNAVLNFTEFVMTGMLGPVNQTQQEALGKALNSGKHLLSLINDVLDITKIEAGKMKLFIEEDIDLRDDIQHVIDTAATLLQNKPVRLVTQIDENLPGVLGDKRRIRQVLLNLMSNACKFTEEGQITFAAAHKTSPQGDIILFAIVDTGPGIPTDEQATIFEPFIQTEAGIQHAGGTGLGLPISKRLIEAHGGRIWLESAPGQGAAFYVSLPVWSEATYASLKQGD